MDFGERNGKEGVTLTSNLRRNAKLWRIATMVRKPLIRFKKLGSIQNQKEAKLPNSHKVTFF